MRYKRFTGACKICELSHSIHMLFTLLKRLRGLIQNLNGPQCRLCVYSGIQESAIKVLQCIFLPLAGIIARKFPALSGANLDRVDTLLDFCEI